MIRRDVFKTPLALAGFAQRASPKPQGDGGAAGEAIKVHTKDGRALSTRTAPAKGSPRNPMTYDEVAGKFRTLSA